MFDMIKLWALRLKSDVVAIYIAGRDSRTPWNVKVIALAVAAYAFSPIDLIPDFIPVLGYLDDLIIIPLGIMIVVRMMPAELMAEYRKKASDQHRPMTNWVAGVIVVGIWVIGGLYLMMLIIGSFYPRF